MMKLLSLPRVLILLLIVQLTLVVPFTTRSAAQSGSDKVELALPESWSEQIDCRSIGPANMSGRITSIAVYEDDPSIWWASSASGGLLKTTNNGITFEHQFDDQATVSIGDVQVSATDPDLVWVGTGEANPRNSVSWGDGVYKSTDGGKTWKNMGLKESFQIGRIAIHPKNHDIVYVGVLGRLWGPSEERGLFKTTDGGKTWKKVLFVDDKTGVIDVQMNPKNPDELLVATYERMRDGFDGNDPVKKYGDGSAIYKTVDGGETFRRLSQGLPTCKLGRIGLSYFLKNPRFVAAIIESEKIAKEPENAPFAGLRGEDADVGAKIVQVNDDGPAAKAGLQENDIVVSIDGDIVYSYNDLLAGIRKHQAGETAKLVVSRERKPVDIVIELDKKPEREGGRNGERRDRRSPFTGTLGGQAANLQGQQGEDEHEYGGVYLSDDGGDSWRRINTLNPRPMYYSQIRIDPTDRKKMYVLGTSLYRSADGGDTFTGDGGRGIHVDHHALWINPRDSRHMILGNDGGIHVTYDRMDNWDHLNHVAIGQFYHVGIGPRIDYRVYGGLQDNGSWGGPARVSNDSGPVNSDWFRVGGGDGFITLVDPDDADHVYFESQNGAMGRINLRTGERGFIRPRPPRGTRYRFNWKTPFILSPHNSGIHFSAGNHVFRSYDKGRGVEAISPEITNTDRGAGSAITESPVRAGVIYAGTTDGAVWMTKNGGQEWVAVYSRPEEKKPEDDQESSDETEESQESEEGAEESEEVSGESESAEEAGAETPTTESDPESNTTDLNGVWNGKMSSDRFPEGQAPAFTMSLKVDDEGKVTGDIETARGTEVISSGKFDAETGELNIEIETRRGRREFSARVQGKKMTGEVTMRGGVFTVDFAAEKQDDPDKSLSNRLPAVRGLVWLNALLYVDRDVDDPVSGLWKGIVRSDQLPDGEIEFVIELKLGDKQQLGGTVDSPRGEFEIVEGSYKPDSKKLYFLCENEEVVLDFEAQLVDGRMQGDVSVNDALVARFEATLVQAARSAAPEAKPQQQQEASDSAGPAASSEQEPESTGEPADAESPVGGRGFLGVMVNENLEIGQVVEGAPAQQAGLKPGDLIQAVGDQEIKTRQDLIGELRDKRPGDTVRITFVRDGEESSIEVKLAAAPATAGSDTPRGRRPRGNQESAADPSQQGDESEAAAAETQVAADDPVSGTWEGVMKSPRGDSELTLVLKRKSDKQITGSYQTPRSDGEITEGTFNPETGALSLVSDSGQFTLEFTGKIENDACEGEVAFNAGTFSMDFNVKRTSRGSGGGDGNIAATEDAGQPGARLEDLLPGPRWVSSLHASRFKAERCYATFDGHRSNDDEPYLFVTEDYGKSWKSVRGNLPSTAGSVRVLREDRVNENVLYLGCEFGPWVSIDRGATWTRMKQMPTVAVHEFAQHPTLDDMAIATHGRSLWIADVSVLRQTDPDSRSEAAKLFKPRNVYSWRSTARRGDSGTRRFVGRNPENVARVAYGLGKNARRVELTIVDLKGEVVKRFDQPPAARGLHTLEWDLRTEGSGRGRGRFGPRIAVGDYLVNLRVDGELLQSTLSIKPDPDQPADAVAADEELQWWLEISGEFDRP